MILSQVIRYDNTPALEATWVDASGHVPRCHAYDATQMGELRDDLGAAAAQYEDLIQQRSADYVPPSPPDPKEMVLGTILGLEASAQTASQRLYREVILATMETQAKAANITLEQLAAKNKGYRELKAFNTQIEALREILKGTT